MKQSSPNTQLLLKMKEEAEQRLRELTKQKSSKAPKNNKELYENSEKSVFPLYKGLIRSYLQLIWDPQNNAIYEDCASNAYGPNKEFIPLQDDVSFTLYDNSDINLIVHAD